MARTAVMIGLHGLRGSYTAGITEVSLLTVVIANRARQARFTLTNRGAAGAPAVNRRKLIDSFAERRGEQPCLGFLCAPAFFAHAVVQEI